jgi:excisionase family DNA binding protein
LVAIVSLSFAIVAGVIAGDIPGNGGETSMNSPLAYSISEACAVTRAGRTALYEAIQSGALRAVKRGRRTLVLADDLRRYLEGLPAIEPNPEVDNEAPDASHVGTKKVLNMSFLTPARENGQAGTRPMSVRQRLRHGRASGRAHPGESR